MDINKNHQTINERDKITKLFLLFTTYQLALHIYFSLSARDPRLFVPTVIAFIHDAVLLSIIAAIGNLLFILIPQKIKKVFHRTFLTCFIIIGALFASYPKILREYLAFPVNIFDADFSSAKVLVSDYLGITALLPSLIAFILGVSVIFLKARIRIPNKIKVAGFLFC
ncbi:MAG: hypothetical protein AB1298_08645 [Bacteroidota bacterium]